MMSKIQPVVTGVVKHHSEGKNVRRIYSPYKIKRKWYKKILGKSDISKKNKTRVALGALAYRRTIERRAAASTKA